MIGCILILLHKILKINLNNKILFYLMELKIKKGLIKNLRKKIKKNKHHIFYHFIYLL